jgi:hypothetical protein
MLAQLDLLAASNSERGGYSQADSHFSALLQSGELEMASHHMHADHLLDL